MREKLIDQVLEQIKKDILENDLTAIETLIEKIDENSLMAFLPEKLGKKFKNEIKLNFIETVINDFGSFTPNEIGEDSIVLQSTKNTSSLIERIHSTYVFVVDYVHEMETNESEIDLVDLNDDIIDQIVTLVEIYKTDTEKTLKRIE